VCAFIKYGIDFVSFDVPSAFSDFKLLVFDVLGVHTKYRFILSDEAPGYHDNNIVLLTKAIDHFCASYASVVLSGDFNLPQFTYWSSPNNYVSGTVSINTSLIDCIQRNALVQRVEDAMQK